MKLTGMVLAAGMLVFAAGGAEALPVMPAPLVATDGAPIVLARAGCGFGAHRGPYGGCRLNRGPRGAIRGFISGRPRGFCPPGTHRGPRGGCRRY